MLPFNCILIPLISLFASCSTIEYDSLTSEAFVVLIDNNDANNAKWANYLFTHLKKRSDSGPQISKQDRETYVSMGAFELQIEIQTTLSHSYQIRREKNKLLLIARSESIALWLTYEVIGRIGEDNLGVDISDLPPSTIAFTKACKNLDFEYREPFWAPNTELEYARLLGNHSIDADWGIWGHQLARIVDNKNLSTQAMIDGKKTTEQFCFSSASLYVQVKAYIIDQYGDTPTQNFMLAPNDNDLVCNCQNCLLAHNTTSDSSPTVLQFNNRLAKDFPTARFFMLAYRTTKNNPVLKLEKNVGVVLSTIDLIKGHAVDENSHAFQVFKRQIDSWKPQTNEIYLWDYAANFDDYLTPIPVLLSFQDQVQQFKALGIKGLFVHGNGYDYAPFDDLKTYVISALMKDVHSDVYSLITRYLKRFYPQSHKLLEHYYVKLEFDFQEKKNAYELYSGFEDLQDRYFNPDHFSEFYASLHQIIPITQSTERVKLEKLYSALSFTQLQLAYSKGFKAGGAFSKINNQVEVNSHTKKTFADLKKAALTQNIPNYSERNHLDSYLQQWQQWIDTPYPINQIKSHDFVSTNRLLAGLTDNKWGFENDFLFGWTISNQNLDLGIHQIPSGVRLIKLRFLKDSAHHIYPPKAVHMHYTDSSQLLDGIVSSQTETLIEYQFQIKESTINTPIRLKITNNSYPKSQWACDEIQFLNN